MKVRTWFRIHSFTGVITGLLLFIICWSGTFAVIAHELDWLVTPETRIDVPKAPLDWEAMVRNVEDAYPDATLRWLSAPLHPLSSAEVIIDLPEKKSVRVYADPASAELLGDYSYFNVQRFFRSFHRNLFLPGIGIYVVSAFAVSMLVSLVAALMFYKRWWRRFFRWPKLHSRSFWSELHKTGGLWSLWFLVVIGITGLWYLVEAARYDFIDGKISYAGTAHYAIHQLPVPNHPNGLPAQPLTQLIEKARTERPDLEIRSVYIDGPTIVIQGQSDHLLVRDRANRVRLDRYTGEVLYNQTPHDYSLYWRWTDTADPLHFGDFGGLWSKSIWFLFGLLLSGLILSGTYLHARRLAGEAKERHRWPGTSAAMVVSVLVLAASSSFGFIEVRDYYGLVVEGAHQFPNLAPGVSAVINGWIAVTLGILAGWVWMLWRSTSALQRRPTD
ncbi:PepSY-associated TM helix domain-containing protein [Marinobacterium iners]|uniref:Uncharacterized iron-regulated membrane protein n=1 Tax=Marinobacterium iners DSM 11526 TaxID=1122198 RepID=A0A1H4G9G2_9GAMM|nr:PepSY-associated TM helix domain-containing protein [Marinobacterium iners]SEB05660.1 Uncharacterized iron-regulated membrane protein [Marinobacterium iners DSM 11526]